jgi:hypothetical protein
MAKDDIRHYSIEELRARNARGEFAGAGAHTVDLDEDFWRELETAPLTPLAREPVEIFISQLALERFADANPDYRAEMARVLEAYAETRAKKAS